jgi:cytochrome b pre-mRNA-processing protein 3
MTAGEAWVVNTMRPGRQSPPLPARAHRWLRRFRPDAADRARREVAERVYRDLVKQARTPSFYRDLGVPDTPEGRFEMVGLHAALVVRRLRAAGAPGSALAQELFDLLFADVDEGLRHIGIGDLAVGKHVRRLAGYFYARLRFLDDALDAVPAAALGPMLRTNVYHNAVAPSERQLAALASYLIAADAALRAHPTARMLAGDLAWAPLERACDQVPQANSKSS